LKIKLDQVLVTVAVVLLLGLAWLGLKGGVEQWPASRSPGQKVQSVAQFAYGTFSLLALATGVGSARIARAVQVSWLVCLTIAGGLAPPVWGASGWGRGILAGVATLVIGWGILWLLHRGARGLTRA